MGDLIARFDDGSFLEFSQGKFDSFCVFEVMPNGNRKPPRDADYFQVLMDCSSYLDALTVYKDFVCVYDSTGQLVEQEVVKSIFVLAEKYGTEKLKFAKAMCMIYAGMIAENNKAFTKLGKRIKRLGVYVLLMEEGSLHFAANFMRGKNWREIDAMCLQRGF
jgi:hypothetical protein